MKCPGCGNSDAYMGFASIDCPDSSCRHYQGSSRLPTPTATAVAPSQGSTGSATIAANPGLALDIITQTPKKSTVELTFVARGDPGYPNKTVEFLWSLPGQATAVICTLSSRNTYYVAGIDADGVTVYTTQWRCTLDGVQPTDTFTLSARVF